MNLQGCFTSDSTMTLPFHAFSPYVTLTVKILTLYIYLLSQTISISMLLRYCHHQIFVFIGKCKLCLFKFKYLKKRESQLLKQVDVKYSKIVSKLQILSDKGDITFHIDQKQKVLSSLSFQRTNIFDFMTSLCFTQKKL